MAAKKKTSQKTTMRKPAHGRGMLRNGGTNKGGPGRPPDAFKQLCRDLASGDLTVDQVERILTDRDHPQFMAALRWATEHGYGKAKETVEVNQSVRHYVVNVPAKGADPVRWQQLYSRN